MSNEWEKLPKETKKEVHDAFVDGYAKHGVEKLEEFLQEKGVLKKIEDDARRTEAYKLFIQRWVDYLIYTEDIEEKDDIASKLHEVAENDKSDIVREAAAKALRRYYGK